MVSANGLNHWPAIPCMKATGANTATIEKVVAATAIPISLVPSNAAVMWSLPISTWRTMFSRTTMASSIRMPMASDSPSSDMVLRVKPQAQTAMKAESTDTGSARPVITVERQELRNTKTTSTVSSAPSISASSTLRTELRTRSPASRTTDSFTPGGRVGWIFAIAAFTASETVVVLAPLDLVMSMPTASWWLNRASERCSAVPSRTSATCPRRTSWPLRELTTSCAKSSGLSRRPFRRIDCSVRRPWSCPTGAARFCPCTAWTTWAMVIPDEAMSPGRTSIEISRLAPPTTVTCETPLIPRSERVMPGSASRVISGGDMRSEASTSETIGWSSGSNLRSTGSSISGGRSLRIPEMASRTSWVAWSGSLLKTNCTTMVAKPSSEVELILSIPERPLKASSMRSTTSCSTWVGEAPG